MIKSKTGSVWHGIFALLVLIASTSFFFMPIFLIGLIKLFPFNRWRAYCTRVIDFFVLSWIYVNNFYIRLTHKTRWQIQGLENLKDNSWHLVVANHQSWLDIVVLQYTLNKKIPVMKFFIKDQLKWIPLLGFAWWAMGCPFMKRYSKDYLLKKPHKRGKDLASTCKAVTLFKNNPSTIMNFVEGTRFTKAKKTSQQSPYHYLLKPRAGGISFVIGTLDQYITSLTDLTIIYPKEKHSLWDFLCHRLDIIYVQLRQIPIPAHFRSKNLLQDEQLQSEFRQWLNNKWQEKDELIKYIKQDSLNLPNEFKTKN